MALVDGIAAIIAVLALYVSLGQLRAQQTHNRLSVKPIPVVSTINLVQAVKISVRNIGAGPCFISNMQVARGVEVKKSVYDWMPRRPEDVKWDRYYPSADGTVIAPSEELILISYTNRWKNENSSSFLSDVKVALDGLAISFDYTDIYDSDFTRASFEPLSTPVKTSDYQEQ